MVRATDFKGNGTMFVTAGSGIEIFLGFVLG